MTEVNTTDGDGGPVQRAGLSGRNWATLAVLTLSSLVVMLDVSVVNVALPAMLQDLGGTLDQATWLLAGFVLPFAALLLAFGRLADIYGRRLLFVAGIVVFTVASLAAALAASVQFLIAARVAQGIGAAMVEPTVLAVIRASFPPGRTGLAFGVQGIAAGLGASLGPTVGGLVTTSLSWEYIFLLNVPVGIVAVVGALLLVPESRAELATRTLDLPGLLLSAAGIFFLVLAIVEGPRLGWGSTVILGSFAASAVLLALFAAVELRVREPLVDLGLFRDRLFAVGNFLRAVVEFATLGLFFPLMLFLQIELGYSALQSGLMSLPLVFASIVASPLAGGISDRVDVRWLVVPGMLMVAGGTFWLAHVSPRTGWTFFVAPLVIAGAGLGALQAPTTSATLREIPAARSGIAASVSYTSFLLGAELGVAVAGALLQNRFVAAVREGLAGTELSPQAADEIVSALSEGGVQPGEANLPGGAQVAGIVQDAFAAAVNAALLGCVAAAIVGAIVAPFFVSTRRGAPGGSSADPATGAR